MTHYPPEKVRSDPKKPQDNKPTEPQAHTPTGGGHDTRHTLAEGVQTDHVTTGRTQGASYQN